MSWVGFGDSRGSSFSSTFCETKKIKKIKYTYDVYLLNIVIMKIQKYILYQQSLLCHKPFPKVTADISTGSLVLAFLFTQLSSSASDPIRWYTASLLAKLVYRHYQLSKVELQLCCIFIVACPASQHDCTVTCQISRPGPTCALLHSYGTQTLHKIERSVLNARVGLAQKILISGRLSFLVISR